MGDKEGQAIMMNYLGVAYEHLDFINEARQTYKKAAKLFEQVGNNIAAAATLINLSQLPAGQEIPAYERLQNLERALALLTGTEATDVPCQSL